MKVSIKTLLAILVFTVCVAAAEATEYPSQKITLIVPFAAGGTNDVTARLIGAALSRELNTPVVVENKPGAGSVIGTEFAARAQPDGYTLLVGGLSAIALNPTIYKKLPYDPRSDFVPLAMIGEVPFVVVANPGVKAKSMSELIGFAKANPGAVTMASAGVGSPHHLFGELFANMGHLKFTHVPYRGSQLAINDLLAGHVDIMVADLLVAKALIDSGRLRAMAVTTKQRLPDLLRVPTLHEVGLSGYDASAWLMLLGPINMPQPIKETLHNAAKKALARKDVQARIAELMIPKDTPSISTLKEFVKDEIDRWAKTINFAGLSASQ